MSWVWSYKVRMVITTLRAYVERTGKNPHDVCLWVCFFSNNQFRMNKQNADNLDTVFENRLFRIGHVIAMLDTWKNPVSLLLTSHHHDRPIVTIE